MKEELQKLYLSEEFINATDEEKVALTTKTLGPLTMPKDVFNDLNERYKSLETKHQSTVNDFETFKKERMTEEERAVEERNDFANRERELAIKSNKLDVIRKLEKAGLTEEDYEGQLDLIVSEDAEKSLKLADFLVNTLNSNSEKVKKETQINLLNDTPKPVVGTSENVNSRLDELIEGYKKAVDDKDTVAQVKFQRLIYEEKSKQM